MLKLPATFSSFTAASTMDGKIVELQFVADRDATKMSLAKKLFNKYGNQLFNNAK